MRLKLLGIVIALLIFAPMGVSAQSSKDIAVPEFTRSLSLGVRGDDVRSLQEFLARDSEIYPEGLTTGFYGPKTVEAVRRWQKKNNVEAVGIVGPKTIAKFKEIGRTKIENLQGTATTPGTATTTTSSILVPSTIPNDTTPTTVTLTLSIPAPTSIYIQFNPSEEVIAVYEYGLTTNYGSVQEVWNQYFSSLTGTYLENLTPSTTYQIRAKVTDRAGNIGYSQNYTFITPSLSQAPIISAGPSIAPSAATPAVAVAVSWGTNIACTGTLHYGTSATFGNTQTSGHTTSHLAVITGLAPGATYVYKVTCATTKKTVESDNFIFTATSSNPSSSAVFNPSLASIGETLKGIIKKIKIW